MFKASKFWCRHEVGRVKWIRLEKKQNSLYPNEYSHKITEIILKYHLKENNG